LGNM